MRSEWYGKKNLSALLNGVNGRGKISTSPMPDALTYFITAKNYNCNMFLKSSPGRRERATTAIEVLWRRRPSPVWRPRQS